MPGILAEQLPWVLGTDERFAAFVDLFDPVSTELYERAGDKEHLFDVQIAPLEMVRWLAGVIGVTIGADLPESRQRDIARTASLTFDRRGTAGSLAKNLQTVAQADVVIFDSGSVGFEPLAEASTTSDVVDRPVRVRIDVRSAVPIDRSLLMAVVERELPAHVPIELNVIDLTSTTAERGDTAVAEHGGKP